MAGPGSGSADFAPANLSGPNESALDRKCLRAILGAMKNWKGKWRLALFGSGCLAVFPVSCNSIFDTSKDRRGDGYQYVTVTGSLVPVRVTSGGAASATASPMGVMSAGQFEKVRQQVQEGRTPGK